jgi:regulator of sigma E protease
LRTADIKIRTNVQTGKDETYVDIDNPNYYSIPLENTFDGTSFALEPIGISALLDTYRHDFGEAIVETFKDFGESSMLIVKSLGGLFVGQGWNDVGGPVAIFTQSSKMLSDFGVAQFLDLWAMISVNLAIFNLIPFPGLDGWQLLVVAIEGITKKKVPEKAQQIVSLVGMVLLFALMAFILVKDVVMLF